METGCDFVNEAMPVKGLHFPTLRTSLARSKKKKKEKKNKFYKFRVKKKKIRANVFLYASNTTYWDFKRPHALVFPRLFILFILGW